MSIWKKEKPPESLLKPEYAPELPSDPLAEELDSLATNERTDITRKIFDLESTERTLLNIGMQKDSGITPDSKLPEILDYVRSELKRNRELKDILP